MAGLDFLLRLAPTLKNKECAEILPFLSSTRAAGDISRLALRDDSDLVFGGLFCGGRDDSVGVLELEPELEAECVLCNVRGSSVGVSEWLSRGLSISGENG